FTVASGAKRVAMLDELVPTAPLIAFLANPKDPELTPQLAPITDAAHALGCRLVVVHASTPAEIDAAFAALLQQGAGAVIVAAGAFFVNQRAQLIALAAQHAMPCIYTDTQAVAARGLMAYGNDLED